MSEKSVRSRVQKSVEGQVPPHDLAAESSLLSCIMHHPDIMPDVLNVVSEKDFYGTNHQVIFAACVAVASVNKRIDVIAVSGWLRDHGKLETAGNNHYLTVIMDQPGTAYSSVEYARRVAAKSGMRAIIAECQAIAAEGYGLNTEDGAPAWVDDTNVWVDKAGSRLSAIAEKRSVEELYTLHDFGVLYARGLAAECEAGAPPAGGRFGLVGLDSVFSMPPGGLTIVGGYPGDGKSCLGLQAARATAEDERKDLSASLIITAEMTGEEIAGRDAFSRASVDSGRARNGGRNLTVDNWRALADAFAKFQKRVYVKDVAGLDVDDLTMIVRRHQSKAEKGKSTLRLVVVDYLQLISGRRRLPRGANRESEVAAVAYGLKAVAKACGVHVLALAQLNDDASKRKKEDQRPTAADFRESKAIWMAADNCLLIHNPAARERSKLGGQATGAEPVTLILDKCRTAAPRSIPSMFVPRFTRFEDDPNTLVPAEPRNYS